MHSFPHCVYCFIKEFFSHCLAIPCADSLKLCNLKNVAAVVMTYTHVSAKEAALHCMPLYHLSV